MALSVGTRLGPYEILAPLGAGGMGQVYRARDARLARDVALKVLPPEVSENPERRRRFEREARAASSLNHPSIVHVYDVGSSGTIHYIAMELVDGCTLREVLSSGPLQTKRLLEIAIEIADGLAKAHASGIVHRDLKPENLAVTREGHVKILDFGLAKVLEEGAGARPDQTTATAHGTRPGQVLGTTAYMSPEQAVGKAVDFHSDQFSLGVVLYEMATGGHPFRGNSAPETLAALLRDQPEPLAKVASGLPAVLRWVVEDRCLAKDPQERYASTWDLLRELRSIRDHLSEAAEGVAATASARMPPPPTFRQLTFGRGTILSARFAPDAETILYGAAWDGRPVEPFLTRLGSPSSRPLGFPGAEVLAISGSGEMAVSLKRRYIGGWQFAGLLARVALAGDSPRHVLEDVQWADWSPDGKSLAVVRDVGGKSRIEYPIGTVLYETAGWISHPRVSPRGDLAAFLEHPSQPDDFGSVALVDRSGTKRALSGEWANVQGLAWAATGDEIWFTAATQGFARNLRAVTLAGVERLIATAPGNLTLHDVSRNGRVLLAREGYRTGIQGVPPGSGTERDLSALDWSVVADLSADGKTLLIREEGQGPHGSYAVYLRQTDADSPPVLLGEGSALALSPDGRWVLAHLLSHPRQLMLLPTGAGEVTRLPETGLEYQQWGSFLPDGQRVVCLANEPGRAVRLYVQSLDGGRPRAMTPEGVSLSTGQQTVSPDGALVAALAPDRKAMLFPVEAGEPRAALGVEPGEVPGRFTADGRSLYVFRRGELPTRVFRVDLTTGRRVLWRQIAPSDPAGLARGVISVLPTPDGESYVYSVNRILSELYLAEGLK